MDKVYNFSTGNAPGSFNDLYTKYERLGRGGFGYVFKVEHNPTKEILAVKEIRDVGDLSPSFKNLVDTELSIMKSCVHENIVQLREHFFENDTVYIIMEICPNGDLRAAIKAQKSTNKPFNQGKLLVWFFQILKAVVYLHNEKIIHRDIKPQNILLSASFIIKLTDFGVSKIQGKI